MLTTLLRHHLSAQIKPTITLFLPPQYRVNNFPTWQLPLDLVKQVKAETNIPLTHNNIESAKFIVESRKGLHDDELFHTKDSDTQNFLSVCIEAIESLREEIKIINEIPNENVKSFFRDGNLWRVRHLALAVEQSKQCLFSERNKPVDLWQQVGSLLMEHSYRATTLDSLLIKPENFRLSDLVSRLLFFKNMLADFQANLTNTFYLSHMKQTGTSSNIILAALVTQLGMLALFSHPLDRKHFIEIENCFTKTIEADQNVSEHASLLKAWENNFQLLRAEQRLLIEKPNMEKVEPVSTISKMRW
jgi:hypothetical protein